jgi:hypothetical protein
VTGKRLAIRIALTLGLAVFLFATLGALRAEAAPIHPDIRKLLAEPQDTSVSFIPARAGWDGPEMPPQRRSDNPALNPALVRRANEAALLSAATPDLRAVAGIIAIIFLLRLFKTRERRAAEAKAQSIAVVHQEDRLAA